MIVITHNNLKKWKADSIKIAKKLGYNESLLDLLNANLKFRINYNRRPKGIWFGYAHYEKKEPCIEVYSKNLSCENIPRIVEELKNAGISQKTIRSIILLLVIVPRKIFFNVYNQSGMDHELIGHVYNMYAKVDYSEKTAIIVELNFINERIRRGSFLNKLFWKGFSYFAPLILYYHKKDEF